MVNVLEVTSRYENEWIVLDKSHKVLDHGPELGALWEKWAKAPQRLSFYFASGFAL